VARTIADLEGADGIASEHMAEALGYRAEGSLGDGTTSVPGTRSSW
jgi:predicted ATPase with chaperone activity